MKSLNSINESIKKGLKGLGMLGFVLIAISAIFLIPFIFFNDSIIGSFYCHLVHFEFYKFELGIFEYLGNFVGNPLFCLVN